MPPAAAAPSPSRSAAPAPPRSTCSGAAHRPSCWRLPGLVVIKCMTVVQHACSHALAVAEPIVAQRYHAQGWHCNSLLSTAAVDPLGLAAPTPRMRCADSVLTALVPAHLQPVPATVCHPGRPGTGPGCGTARVAGASHQQGELLGCSLQSEPQDTWIMLRRQECITSTGSHAVAEPHTAGRLFDGITSRSPQDTVHLLVEASATLLLRASCHVWHSKPGTCACP